MTQAAVALEALGAEDPNFLPRSDSFRSAPIFRQLIAAENLTLLRVSDVPLSERAAAAFQYHEALARIFGVYRSAFRGAGRGDAELAELIGAQLRLSAIVLDLNAEYVKSLKPGDPHYQERTEGAETIQAGAVTIIRGSLRTLSERNLYRSSERARLVTQLRETLPGLLRRIAPDVRKDISAAVDQLAADPALEELQPGLGGLRVAARSR